MMFSKLALFAMLAAGAVNAEDFDPSRAASRSRRRALTSRTTTTEIDENSSSGVLVEEDIYGNMAEAASVDEGDEEVSAFASATADSPCGPGWKLLWNDEFKYPGKPDKNAWSYLEGDGSAFGIPGWGNNELQTYTKSSKNVRVSKGKLNLIARRDGKKITSGAVRTYRKVAVAPKKNGAIRVDVTMQLPSKIGLKPFVQMLPNESPSNVLGAGHYGDWSQSGAIINAQRTNTEKGFSGGILYGGVSPNVAASTFAVPNMKDSKGTHTFSTEWSLSSMKFYQDSKQVFKAKNWYTNDTGNVPKGAPFDKPFYIMIALATGGDQTGVTPAQVIKTLRKPQTFKIDYLQICEKV
jgi:hypothetical protein